MVYGYLDGEKGIKFEKWGKWPYFWCSQSTVGFEIYIFKIFPFFIQTLSVIL